LLVLEGWPSSVHEKALVCLSGGVDSTAALFRCYQQFVSVRAVFVKTAGKNLASYFSNFVDGR
jgi:tRNA U34 2-thiouridine synthase MnmA/TrmU